MVKIGNEKKRSRTHQEGGKKPKWTDILSFKPTTKIMEISVMDQDTITDDLVGEAKV